MKNTNENTIIIVCLFFIFIVLIGFGCYRYGIDNTKYIKSSAYGKEYKVRVFENFDTMTESADYLGDISNRIDEIVNYMHDFKLPNSTISNRIYSRWKKCVLRETHSSEKSAAYTVNKGEELRLCIRDPSNNLENKNTSMFVILHELAHIMSDSYGHNEEFKNNFNFIVHLATALGKYKPEYFHNEPVEYCGTEINTTPCSYGTCNYTSIPFTGPVNSLK